MNTSVCLKKTDAEGNGDAKRVESDAHIRGRSKGGVPFSLFKTPHKDAIHVRARERDLFEEARGASPRVTLKGVAQKYTGAVSALASVFDVDLRSQVGALEPPERAPRFLRRASAPRARAREAERRRDVQRQGKRFANF